MADRIVPCGSPQYNVSCPIQVRYWADNDGFHQEDNLPKIVLKPVEEAEDVRQARLAHEKAWQEAAAAAAQQPDPQYVYKQLAKIRLDKYVHDKNGLLL